MTSSGDTVQDVLGCVKGHETMTSGPLQRLREPTESPADVDAEQRRFLAVIHAWTWSSRLAVVNTC